MSRILGILLILFLCSGCIQTENSSSNDAILYNGDDPVRTILAANCASCHSFHTMTDDELVTAGTVVAGDAENSRLYYRLVGSSGSNGPKNMPLGGALTTDELDLIKEWIEAL